MQKSVQSWFVRRFYTQEMMDRAEFFTAIFDAFLSPSSQVLDIGGGWGFYFEPFLKRGHFLTVLDVQKPGFQRAPLVLYQPSAPFPFPDKSFEASILVTMLHHVPDPAAILREAKRVTRGKIIVVEDLFNHAPGRFWTELRDRIYNFEYWGHPCQFKTSKQWTELFNRLGLTVKHQENVRTHLAGLPILNGVFVLQE